MRFIILLSALMIATAINPEVVSNYLEGTKSLLNVIFFYFIYDGFNRVNS